MSVFVDTSALFAVLDRDDENHAAAARRWKSLLEGPETLVVSNYVLVETTALVHHRLGIGATRTFVNDVVPALTIQWVGTELHAAAVAAHLAAGDRSLSLVDCTSFEVMRSLGVRRVFAFDRRFARHGFELE